MTHFFLRQFISERIKYVLKMKKIYMIKMSAESNKMKSKSNIKKCDQNLTRVI